MIHDEDANDFIDQLLVVVSSLNVGLYETNKDYRGDRCEDEYEELDDQLLPEEHHGYREGNPPNVVKDHVLLQTIFRNVETQVLVEGTIL